MGFPPRDFYSVVDLAARWDCTHLQILDWALAEKLELRIALADVEFEDGTEASWAVIAPASVRPLFRSYGDAERHVFIRRARPPSCSKALKIIDPAEGVKVLASDVLVTAAEIERFEDENNLVRRVVVGPGAPTRHSWERFYVEMCCRIFHDGLPDTQTELVEVMQDWIMDDPNWGEAPDPSTIRKKVKVVWQRLKPE